MIATKYAYAHDHHGDDMVGRAFRDALAEYVIKNEFEVPDAEFKKTTSEEWRLVGIFYVLEPI